jgi:hypothetical protein
MYQEVGAENLGSSLIGEVPDPQTRDWARAQMRRTSLATRYQPSRQYRTSRRTTGQQASTWPPPSSCQHATTSCIRGVSTSLPRRSPGAAIYEWDGDHGAFLNDRETLASILLAACGWASAKNPLEAPTPRALGSAFSRALVPRRRSRFQTPSG